MDAGRRKSYPKGIWEQKRVRKEDPDPEIWQEVVTTVGEREQSLDAPLVCRSGRP